MTEAEILTGRKLVKALRQARLSVVGHRSQIDRGSDRRTKLKTEAQ